jgi:predicted flap endonuclease-1-like 5' DNA nuclease
LELNDVRIGLVALTALVGGSGIGWWLRGRYNYSRRVIMDELWTRKIRSYEASTEQAHAAKTIATSSQREAEERLLEQQNHTLHLEEVARSLEDRHELRLREIAEQRDRIEKLELMAAELDVSLRGERASRAEDQERLQSLQKRLKRLEPFPARMEECEAELAQAEVRLANTSEEKNAEIARLTDWIAELTPLTEALQRRSEEVSTLRQEESESRQRFDQQLAQRDAALEESQLQASVCKDQETLIASLEERLESGQNSTKELEGRLEEQVAALVAAREESIQRDLRITELEVRLRQAEEQRQGSLALTTELEESARVHQETNQKLTKECKDLGEQLNSTRKELEDWLRENERTQETLAEQGRELEGTRKKASKSSRELDKDRNLLAERGEELKSTRTILSAKEKELARSLRRAIKAESQRDRKGEQLNARNETMRQLRDDCSQLRKQQREVERELKARSQELEKERRKSRDGQTPSPPRKRKQAHTDELIPRGSRAKKAAAPRRDDLTAIKGIGTKVAERLESAGVHSYAQLARLKSKQLDELAETIGVPRKRIEREGWIGSATELKQR